MINRVAGEIVEGRVTQLQADGQAMYDHLVAEIRRALQQGFRTSGRHLKALRDQKLWAAGGHATFGECCRAEFDVDESMATRWIQAADVCDHDLLPKLTNGNNLLPNGNPEDLLPIRESHVRPLLALDSPSQRAEVWSRVLALDVSITADVVSAERDRYLAEQARDWYTVDDWRNLTDDDRARLLSGDGRKTFNKQDTDNIEWARWSWNPVTGCLHDCEYCYARDIAARFFPQNFAPSFLPSRLSAPGNTTVPPEAAHDFGYRNVFVCSMADLFGKWVPAEWIEAVLAQVRANPQWTFLFLTKFPIRMAEFDYPPNVWLGTTVDRQWAVERAEKAFRAIKASGFGGVCWLSCEPMMERLTFTSLEMFDWVVIGGSSKSTRTPEYFPPTEDIRHLCAQVRAAGCRLYEKTNLYGDTGRTREYPT